MRVVTLRDPTSSVAAEFVPEAGMVGTSLSDAGVELLGQRRGLDAYVKAGKTMGIPILYPWANRLGANTYTAEGVTATLTPGENGVRADPNGLPIHGVLAGHPGWRVTAESVDGLTAELDFADDPRLLASFPYPHVLTVAVRLADRTLTVRTTVTATGDLAVPLCFGFHPYLRLPGVPRGEWVIHTPPLRQLALDDRGLPTGASKPAPARDEALGTRLSTMPTTRCPTARCSRSRAAADGWRCASSGVSGDADLRPEGRRPRKRNRVLRADDRTDRRAAPRRLPLRTAGRTGRRAVLDPGVISRAFGAAATPPRRCSWALPPDRGAARRAPAPTRRSVP